MVHTAKPINLSGINMPPLFLFNDAPPHMSTFSPQQKRPSGY